MEGGERDGRGAGCPNPAGRFCVNPGPRCPTIGSPYDNERVNCARMGYAV